MTYTTNKLSISLDISVALPIEVFKCASAVYYALTDVIFQYYFLMMSPDYLGFFRTRSDVIYCLKISTSWH